MARIPEVRKPDLSVARTPPVARVPQPLAAREAPLARRVPLKAFDPAPDPLSEQPKETPPDESTQIELTELQIGFRERMAAEQARFLAVTDASYYFTVCFESGAQATKFLKYFGVGDDLFVDGRILADKLGIDLPKAELKATTNRISPKLAALVKGYK